MLIKKFKKRSKFTERHTVFMDRNTQHKDVNSLQIVVAFSQSIFFSLYPLYFKGLKNLKQPPDFFPQTSSLAFIETNASEEENKVITLYPNLYNLPRVRELEDEFLLNGVKLK